MATSEYPSSGVEGESFVMVTLNSKTSSSTGEDDMESSEKTEPVRPGRNLERRLSSSSTSSTDSCLSEAKYGHIHELDYDFLLWFVKENEKEADIIFKALEKERHLRGFRYDRDKTIGRVHLVNIAEAITKSWKILLLISPEADRWFTNQVYQSLTHDIGEDRSVVVPILLRRGRNDLPTYLRSKYCLFYPSQVTKSSSSPQLSSQMDHMTSSDSASSSEPLSQIDEFSNASSSESRQESIPPGIPGKIEMDRFMASLLRVFDPPPPSPDGKQCTMRSLSSGLSGGLSRSPDSLPLSSSSKPQKKKSQRSQSEPSLNSCSPQSERKKKTGLKKLWSMKKK